MTEFKNVSPADLHIGDNIRTAAAAPRELVDSVRARGVLLPIRAYQDEDGRFIVIDGQLRTLAAREAGVDTVPVLITDAPDVADRLVDQWVANEHRSDLTNLQRVEAVEQMALIGLTEAQIAKLTGTKKATVAQALTVSRSNTTRDHANMLTLEQAAALAELEDHPEAADRLVAAAEQGHFDHELSRIHNEIEDQKLLDEKTAELEAAGITIVSQMSWYTGEDGRAVILQTLTGTDGTPLTEESHRDCPGHVAAISVEWVKTWTDRDGNTYSPDEAYALAESELDRRTEAWNQAGADPETEPRCVELSELGLTVTEDRTARVRWGCSQPKTHASNEKDELSEEERELQRAERREVIENNAAWRAAETVRRQWLAEFAARKTPPVGAEHYVADYVARNQQRKWQAQNLEGIDIDRLTAQIEGSTAKRAIQISLTLALAAWEVETGTHTWRSPRQIDVETLTALSAWGYTLSDIEAQVTNTEEALRF